MSTSIDFYKDLTLQEWFTKFKKIDAHSHIGTFGSPFHIQFDEASLL